MEGQGGVGPLDDGWASDPVARRELRVLVNRGIDETTLEIDTPHAGLGRATVGATQRCFAQRERPRTRCRDHVKCDDLDTGLSYRSSPSEILLVGLDEAIDDTVDLVAVDRPIRHRYLQVICLVTEAHL